MQSYGAIGVLPLNMFTEFSGTLVSSRARLFERASWPRPTLRSPSQGVHALLPL